MRARPPLLILGALAFCGSALAQQIDYSKVRRWPTNKIRRPGTYLVAEQRWVRPGNSTVAQGLPGSTTVYNNTCFWVGGFPNATFFYAVDSCTDIYDNGQIPSPGNPLGPGSGIAGQDNKIVCVSVGYVTFATPGAQSIEYKFWDNLGGSCAGFSSPTPPEPPGQARLPLNSDSALPAPADPSLGSGTGWVFTIDLRGTGDEFCLASDGDGTWAGFGGSGDEFNWRFRHGNNSAVTGSSGEGPFIAHETLAASAGACTFATACGPQIISGFTEGCGSGLGTADAFWVNSDLSAPCTTASSTACFFFGGPPSNPFASFYMQLCSAGECFSADIIAYCSGKTTSQGCIPFISSGGGGLPSETDTNPFYLLGRDAPLGSTGLVIYGFKKANLNFHGGKLCVKTPTRKAGKPSKSKVPEICVGPASIGRTSTNFNNRIQGSFDPMLTAGQKVFAQWQFRDSSNTVGGFGDAATDGLRFTIVP